MIQEANPLRTIMPPDLAEPILGGVYDLYVDALGATVAWWLGHLTLTALIFLTYWVVANLSTIKFGLGINGTRISAWLVLIGATVGQFILYQDQLGFPTSGAFITALSTRLYLWWQWFHIEPQQVCTPRAFMSRWQRHP